MCWFCPTVAQEKLSYCENQSVFEVTTLYQQRMTNKPMCYTKSKIKINYYPVKYA
jgi:hypothetical protein